VGTGGPSGATHRDCGRHWSGELGRHYTPAMEDAGGSVSARALVERLGGHPGSELGLDLASEAGVGGWFVASCLLAGRADEATALGAWRALDALGHSTPTAAAGAGPAALESILAAADVPRPERPAALLVRAGRALAERHAGSLARLAAEAESTEQLAARIARLAPGVGRATVALFLRPLRDVWPAALEVPLAPAARAAAIHLGWIGEGEDEEGEPGALRAALRREAGAPSLADAEAALIRLGTASCLRQRTARCPLGASCPAL
jgi:endonuclease III